MSNIFKEVIDTICKWSDTTYDKLPIEIFTPGDYSGMVNLHIRRNFGNMIEIIIQDNVGFSRAFVPRGYTICYNCGFVRERQDNNPNAIICDECDLEYQVDMEEATK